MNELDDLDEYERDQHARRLDKEWERFHEKQDSETPWGWLFLVGCVLVIIWALP